MTKKQYLFLIQWAVKLVEDAIFTEDGLDSGEGEEFLKKIYDDEKLLTRPEPGPES